MKKNKSVMLLLLTVALILCSSIVLANFNFTINTTSTNQNFTFYVKGVTPTITVDWGDSSTSTYGSAGGSRSHLYNDSGLHYISVNGTGIEVISFGDTVSCINPSCTPTMLLDITSKLNDRVTGITSTKRMFEGATKIINFTNSTFLNDLSGNITDMSYMFYGATLFNGNISTWNTKSVTDMQHMFNGATNFNQSLNSWNVSNVGSMRYMFSNADMYTQDMNTWNMRNVTDVIYMFNGADRFNNNISNWNLTKVTGSIEAMFKDAYRFNQSLAGWDTTNITRFDYLFSGATDFNGNVSGWNTKKIISTYQTFYNAQNFNQSLNTWNMSNNGDCRGIFYNAYAFNGNISNWETQNCTSFQDTFRNARAFNQSINNWNTAKVNTLLYTFYQAYSFNQNLSSWNTSKVTVMTGTFGNARNFTGDISTWDVSNVNAMNSMFDGASRFNSSIANWKVYNVTNFQYMFQASGFNNNISAWNLSKATNVGYMFQNSYFNSPINAWVFPSLTSMNNMFQNAYGFNQNISAWNTTKITSMSYTFSYATIFNQSLSGWDTTNVNTMSNMFQSAYNFSQNISMWKTQNVTTFAYMFNNAYLFNQSINTWNTSKATTFSSMFQGARSYNQPMNLIDTINVNNMAYLFRDTIFNQDISMWKMNNVTTTEQMFYNATKFNQPIENWNISKLTNINGMFMYYAVFNQSLKNWNTENITNMGSLFSTNPTININISSWNTGKVTTFDSMFNTADSFNYSIENWNTSSCSSFANMFRHNHNFNQDLSNWSMINAAQINGMFSNSSYNRSIENWTFLKAVSMNELFAYNTVYNIPVNNLNVTNVNSMYGMFQGATAFNQSLSNWKTYNVTNMGAMFANSNYNLDISFLNTSKVTSTSTMFKNNRVFNQPLENLDMSKVTDPANMFQNASSFNQPLNNWNTTSFQYLYYMFEGASSFNQPLNNWNISNVYSWAGPYYMFKDATSFNQPLNSWKMNNFNNIQRMFYNASSFNQNLSDWNITAVTTMSDMFNYSGLSISNYDITLQSWAAKILQNNTKLDAPQTMYSLSTIPSRSILTSTYNWTINDGGLNTSLVNFVLYNNYSQQYVTNINITLNNSNNQYFFNNQTNEVANGLYTYTIKVPQYNDVVGSILLGNGTTTINSTTNQSTLNIGLVEYFDFNNTINSRITNNVVQNQSSAYTYQIGLKGNGINQGSIDYKAFINISNTKFNIFDNTSSWSFSYWANTPTCPNTMTGCYDFAVFNNANADSPGGMQTMGFGNSFNSGSFAGISYSTSNSFKNGSRMITITHDVSNGTVTIYQNGLNIGSGSSSGFTNTLTNGGYISLGTYTLGTGSYNAWNGTYDEISIYNKALLPSEITALYNSGAGLSYNDVAGINGMIRFITKDGNNNNVNSNFNINGVTKQSNEYFNLTIGDYNVTVTNNDYFSQVINFTVAENQSVDYNITLTPFAKTLKYGITNYYKFNGNTSGNLTTEYFTPGILYNTVQNNGGKFNQSYNFSKNGLVYFPKDSDFIQIQNEDFSVSTWININKFPANGDQEVILCSGYDGNSESYSMHLYTNTTGSTFLQAGGYNNAQGGDSVELLLNNSYLNTWHNVVHTNRNKNVTLYVDGVKIQNKISTIDFVPTVGDAWVGIGAFHMPDAWSRYYNGSVDELIFWNRELNTNEVSSIYNNGNGLEIAKDNSGLIDYYSAEPSNVDNNKSESSTSNNIIYHYLYPTAFNPGIIGNGIRTVKDTPSSYVLTSASRYKFFNNQSDWSYNYWTQLTDYNTTAGVSMDFLAGSVSGPQLAGLNAWSTGLWLKDLAQNLWYQQYDRPDVDDRWIMKTLAYNSTTKQTYYYENAQLVTNGTTNYLNMADGDALYYIIFGTDNGDTYKVYNPNATFDEISMWSKTLSTKDINLLYDGGTAISYSELTNLSTLNFSYYNNMTQTYFNNFNITLNSTTYAENGTTSNSSYLTQVQPGNYTFTISSVGYPNKTGYITVSLGLQNVLVTFNNNAPTVSDNTGTFNYPINGGTVDFICIGSDADGNSLYFNYNVYRNGTLYMSDRSTYSVGPGTGLPVFETTSYFENLTEGETWQVECQADDGYALSSYINSSVITVPYRPVIISVTNNPVVVTDLNTSVEFKCLADHYSQLNVTYEFDLDYNFTDNVTVTSAVIPYNTSYTIYTLNNTFVAGDYYNYSCRAYDGEEYSQYMYGSFNVTGTNLIPIINSSRITPNNPNSTSTLQFYCNATDGDTENVSYNYRVYKNAVSVYNNTTDFVLNGTELNVYNTSSLTIGDNYTLECQAYDNISYSTKVNSTVQVINIAPQVLSARNYPVLPNTLSNLIFYCTADDYDGQYIYYNYTILKNNIVFYNNITDAQAPNIEYRVYNISDLVEGDNYSISCKATDSLNMSDAYNTTNAQIRPFFPVAASGVSASAYYSLTLPSSGLQATIYEDKKYSFDFVIINNGDTTTANLEIVSNYDALDVYFNTLEKKFMSIEIPSKTNKTVTFYVDSKALELGYEYTPQIFVTYPSGELTYNTKLKVEEQKIDGFISLLNYRLFSRDLGGVSLEAGKEVVSSKRLNFTVLGAIITLCIIIVIIAMAASFKTYKKPEDE